MAKAAVQQDQEFLEFVVKALVDKPDKVEVARKIDEMGVLLTLKVDPSDMGTVIGRQGKTAKALRTLLRVVGAKNDARVNLKLEEPEGSTYVRRPRPDEAPAAPAEEAPAPKEKKGKKDASVDDVVDNLNL